MKNIDKLYHFFAGIMIYIIFNLILSYYHPIIPVIFIGAGKEIYDFYSKKGTPDWWDFIWTVIGGILAMICL